MPKYDAIVIGSGQAGNPLSQKLVDHGWTVALIEKDQLGGTCVNTGCTPTKTMIASAQVAYYARSAARWGVYADNVRVDLAKIVERKNHVVAQWRESVQRKIQDRANLHFYRGQARFLDARHLKVGAQVLEAERVFINTGTHPHIPDLPGLQQVDYLTNATIMELTEIPQHLLVLGGGYVGVEFGQMFRRFGSQVTII